MKGPGIQAFLDHLGRHYFGRTLVEAHRDQVCITCGKPVRLDELTTEDATEYMLSGVCPRCFAEAADCE